MSDHKYYEVPHPERQKSNERVSIDFAEHDPGTDGRPSIYGHRHEEIPYNRCDRCGTEIGKWDKRCSFCGCCVKNCD